MGRAVLSFSKCVHTDFEDTLKVMLKKSGEKLLWCKDVRFCTWVELDRHFACKIAAQRELKMFVLKKYKEK